MPIDYQKLTEASLRLKITDLERARRYGRCECCNCLMLVVRAETIKGGMD